MSNFQPFEVVGRRSHTQFQVGENVNYFLTILFSGLRAHDVTFFMVNVYHGPKAHTSEGILYKICHLWFRKRDTCI